MTAMPLRWRALRDVQAVLRAWRREARGAQARGAAALGVAIRVAHGLGRRLTLTVGMRGWVAVSEEKRARLDAFRTQTAHVILGGMFAPWAQLARQEGERKEARATLHCEAARRLSALQAWESAAAAARFAREKEACRAQMQHKVGGWLEEIRERREGERVSATRSEARQVRDCHAAR